MAHIYNWFSYSMIIVKKTYRREIFQSNRYTLMLTIKKNTDYHHNKELQK